MTEFDSNALGQPSDRVSADARWFALWVRSHFEQLVHDQLRAHGFEMFLPTVKVWSRRGERRHVVSMPMLPGYLFTHHPMDRHSHVQILQTRGVVSVLGERWDRLVPVSDSEIAALRRLVATDTPVMPHPYVSKGDRVRIADGPLSGVEGTLVQVKPGKGLLVVSVELLRRSVAVEVDCTCVVPAGNSPIARRSARSAITGASAGSA